MSTHSNAPRIFVSHSHVDAAFAAQLVEDLRQAHTQAWMDTTDLGAGDFQERISAALAGCEWFVLVLTKDALASQWVRQEVNAASRLRHHGQIHDLIFIKAGPVEQRDLPPLWGVYNIFDATTNYAAALAAVLTSVGMSSPLSVLTPQPQQSVPMTPPSAPPIAADHFPQRLASLGFTGHAALGVKWQVSRIYRATAL